MTTFSQITKSLLKDKFSLIHKALGVYLLVTLATCIYQTLIHGIDISTWPIISLGFGSPIATAIFVILAFMLERTWTSPIYRLLPLSETKLYIANLLASFLSFLYFSILATLFIFLTGPSTFMTVLRDMATGKISDYIVGSLILLLMPVFTWSFISLVHLLANTLSDFLPANVQKVARVVLVLVLLYLIGTVAGWVQDVFSSIFVASSSNTEIGFLLAPVYLLVVTTILSAINIYLLKNWIQAAPKAA